MKKEKTFPVDKRFWPGTVLLMILAALFFVFIKSTAAGVVVLFFWAAHIAFFRDPRRAPEGEGVLAPADGKVVEISFCEEPRFICGKAVKIGIFLSLFDVHVNRMPWRGTLHWQEHVPGRFLNALHPDAALKNESNWLGFCDGETKFVVRQISGLVARHIHWDIEKGAALERGDKIGIICYGSRAELYLPAEEFTASVRVGDAVKSARTILGSWKNQ